MTSTPMMLSISNDNVCCWNNIKTMFSVVQHYNVQYKENHFLQEQTCDNNPNTPK